VIPPPKTKAILTLSLFLALLPTACHKGEQAVKGMAQHAVNAEHKAQANATQLDQERAQLEQIPLPTKGMYADVHDPSQWANPFLMVGPEYVDLRILFADVNTSKLTEGTLLRPQSARRQEMQVRLADLDRAVTAIPGGAWPYGRVIAVQESPYAQRKDRAAVRRNVEAVIRRLNDLGVVVEEWPSR
jgi:hypothetical protein